MAAFKGKSRQIRDALMVVMSDITIDRDGNGETPAFHHVTASTKTVFDGVPVCQVLPNDYPTDPGSVAQQDRTVNFVLRVYVPLDGNDVDQETTDWLYDLTDKMIDAIAIGDVTSALHTADPQLNTLLLDSRRATWSTLSTTAGVMLACDVDVEVRYSKDLY
ncbi:hypothetical protein [Williamsia sterculiae]|uniref:Uncharacterized protein n=1 Tax=Williamsia sterculiae TaxID=1344003 RepID=A0A1N7GFJ7_9NOCA|nr:hypothetical protein [Williamsia sterculiae]SIS11363.1 hypothetical protein SAMN05445060_2728 [Williamsia sterculiae]